MIMKKDSNCCAHCGCACKNSFEEWAFGSMSSIFNFGSTQINAPLFLMECWNRRHGHILKIDKGDMLEPSLEKMILIWMNETRKDVKENIA